MLQKEAVERVDSLTSPGFYSRLYLVPKKTGGLRPIIDLSPLNRFLVAPKFKMESVHSIRRGLTVGAFTYSVDLKDAYFQIPIHRSSRKYLRFAFGDEVYQFRALPFGLNSAPWLFTRVMLEVKRLAHKGGLSIFQYLDDWLGQAQEEGRAAADASLLVRLCQHLGLKVNFEKSDLIPTQVFIFLGVAFDLLHGTVRPTEDRAREIRALIRQFVGASSMPAVRWQSLIGTLVAQEKFVEFGRFHLRPLQWHLPCESSRMHPLGVGVQTVRDRHSRALGPERRVSCTSTCSR